MYEHVACWDHPRLHNGIALTGRNTTGPPRAAPCELRCICECYRRRRQTTDDDRRPRPLLVWPSYTMCRRASNKYVGPAYCRAEMFAGRVAWCPLVSHSGFADGTDRRTDRPLHYAFRYMRPA